ncbi:hypothetical protein [Hymenobacter persicinus]|uniref:STAS/SEC14 domain-containing protein n=1 Tax=Hymenobacter persicinus TaxID=2025506 RepID=A0A4Q5LDL5_9BACT|nr:hypothetical protein [Hymenobacter persicinus]RYU81836.1 hypothetical protein EWM57_05500 [Hymenobacter persicinus]
MMAWPLENSSLTLLGDTTSVQIWYDAGARWLYVRWRGNYREQDAGAGWVLLLRCLRLQPCTKLLNDARDAVEGWAGREQWAGEALFPQLAERGVRSVACVYLEALAARFSLDTTLGSTPKPFVAAFDDLATACAWLQQR